MIAAKMFLMHLFLCKFSVNMSVYMQEYENAEYENRIL